MTQLSLNTVMCSNLKQDVHVCTCVCMCLCVCSKREEESFLVASGGLSTNSPVTIKIIVAHPCIALTKGIYCVLTHVTLTLSLRGTNAIICFTDETKSTERLSNLPKVTWLAGGETGLQA